MPDMPSFLILSPIGVLTVLFLTLFFNFRRQPSQPLPLPPGPKGLPFIGNLQDIASKSGLPVHQEYLRLSQLYGDIFHLRVPGHRTIVLSSGAGMIALLEKRSSNYSDRPGE